MCFLLQFSGELERKCESIGQDVHLHRFLLIIFLIHRLYIVYTFHDENRLRCRGRSKRLSREERKTAIENNSVRDEKNFERRIFLPPRIQLNGGGDKSFRGQRFENWIILEERKQEAGFIKIY